MKLSGCLSLRIAYVMSHFLFFVIGYINIVDFLLTINEVNFSEALELLRLRLINLTSCCRASCVWCL